MNRSGKFSHSARIFLAVALLVISLSACKEKPKNPVAEYGNTVVDTYQKSRNAADIANLDALRKAVQEYRALHEEYPKSLQDVDSLAGSGIALEKYDYDPTSGAVNLKAAP